MKKIAVVNDISGFGRCSLSAALPVMSALGVQCCPLVSGVFSAQTGYPGFQCTDLTGYMLPFAKNWKEMGQQFDGILTGFISSPEQGRILLEIINELKSESTLVVVDPVMGDEGKIYPCYTDESIQIVKQLVRKADIITPNLSELCVLAEKDFLDENVPEEELLEKIRDYSAIVSAGRLTVITTGINLADGEIGTAVYEGDEFSLARAKKYGCSFSGTGDIFASVLTAQAVKGVQLKTAVEQAVKFISDCAKVTIEKSNGNYDRNDGVYFEEKLGDLTAMKESYE